MSLGSSSIARCSRLGRPPTPPGTEPSPRESRSRRPKPRSARATPPSSRRLQPSRRECGLALGVVVDARDPPVADREDVVDAVIKLDLEHAGAACVEDRVAFGADQLDRLDLARLVTLAGERVHDLVGTVADPFVLESLPDDLGS